MKTYINRDPSKPPYIVKLCDACLEDENNYGYFKFEELEKIDDQTANQHICDRCRYDETLCEH